MSKILAIDTATHACSVALLVNKEIQEIYSYAPQQHTQLILPMIDQLLAKNNLTLSQLDALAFSKGPGSFTGLRIGAGIIQGLALGADLPVVPISTLQTLAQGAFREKKISHALPSLDAYRGEVYWSAYRLENNLMVAEIEDQLCLPEIIPIPSEHNWTGIGDAWKLYAKVFKKRLGERLQTFDSELTPHAQDVATLACDAFARGYYVTAEQALPVYLRGKEAWKSKNPP